MCCFAITYYWFMLKITRKVPSRPPHCEFTCIPRHRVDLHMFGHSENRLSNGKIVQCSSAYQQATDYIFIAWWLEQCHENYVEHDLILFKDSTTRRGDSTIKMWTHNSFGLVTLACSHVAAQLRRQTTTFRIMRRSCKYKRKSFVSLFIAPRW